MPVHISPDIRVGIIRHWLLGESRDQIASQLGISKGTVSNVVNEWRNNLGSYIADDLRELSLSLKKAQLSPLECASGLRIEKMMHKIGIDEDQFEYFMSEIYKKCQELEISPKQIGEYMIETINLSEIVFPSQIPNYIHTKKEEIKNLENQIEGKHEIISKLNKEIGKLEEKQEALIKNNDISNEAINWYKNTKAELTTMGIPFDDISIFIDCLRGIKNQNYEVDKIVKKSTELLYFDKVVEDHNKIRNQKIYEIEQLKQIKIELEKQIQFIQLKLSKNQELENIGIGFKELKTIYNTIIEIAKANKINPKETIDAFFDDLTEYDDIIYFKKKREDLRKEISSLSIQIANNRMIFTAQQHIGSVLQELLKIGITEKDIADINSILLLGRFEYNKDDNNNNDIIINKQNLVSELTKYRNIKLVIKSLEQKQIQLKNNIKELENQKTALESYLHHLFMIFSNLNEIQILLKKANRGLDYPKIIFIYYNNSNNDNSQD
ncbi:MAG TPA: helix-turn-helix domain-containing protein [Nitrososphaeraceae archaeon]|nr:helix-turn-helix domain-containing protein [Nitrososphaeraceae archaeon]